jgi:hypothetical protein
VSETESAFAASRTRRVDRSRQAVPRETTAARPQGEGPIGERGGGRTFSPTSAPAMTTATYTLERCAEEWRRGTGRSRSDSIEGVRVYFVVGAARGPSRRGFGSRRSRSGTHRHRGLVERFEHGVRGYVSEEAFARSGLCPHAGEGGRRKPDRYLSVFAGRPPSSVPGLQPWRKNLGLILPSRGALVYEHLVTC